MSDGNVSLAQPSGLSEVGRAFVQQEQLHKASAIDMLDVGVVLLDAALRVVEFNAALMDFLPGSDGRLHSGCGFGEVIREAVDRRDILVEREILERWLENPSDIRGGEILLRSSDDRWARVQARPIRGGGTLVSFTDITEFKRRELWLTKMHERLAGEGEDLKVFAGRLAVARSSATRALRQAEEANKALGREVAERRTLERELRRLANTDSLTGVLNRRRFIALTEKEIERAVRFKRKLCLLMLDLDHFKTINDRFGHEAGDAALVRFSELCQQVLRDTDLFARLGGEEFAALLPETSEETAMEIANRLCKEVAETPVLHGSEKIHISVSIGLSTLLEQEPMPLAILSRADRALYRAKQTGRNKVMAAEPHVAETSKVVSFAQKEKGAQRE